MAESDQASDLIEVFHHEHDHLRKLFEDIGHTFEKLAGGELEEPRRTEVAETAADDLALALEEMLHHFNQEEEVFFVEIERQYPETADAIAELASAHELMGEKTRWLHRQLSRSPDAIADNVDEIRNVVKQMRELLVEHTENERRLFDSVLENMDAEDRDSLLQEMRRI